MRTIRTIVIAGWIATMLWGGDAHTTANPRPAVPSKAAPAKNAVRPGLSDAQLETAIRERFARSKAGADKFQVHVQGGVATIEGRTDVVQHKGSATRMARSAGAAAVQNRIQVSDAARQKSAANLETGRRRAQVKRGDARSDPRSDPRQPKQVR